MCNNMIHYVNVIFSAKCENMKNLEAPLGHSKTLDRTMK